MVDNMSRNLIKTQNEIFDILASYVCDDDRYRIANVTRYIIISSCEQIRKEEVIDFLICAKMKLVNHYQYDACLFVFDNKKYILVPNECVLPLCEIGFEISSNKSINLATGLLAISKNKLMLKKGITSMSIINNCLGINDENGEKGVSFDSLDIINLFEDYAVFLIDDSIFQTIYDEDINRLFCYICSFNNPKLSCDVKKSIKSISLLHSSRSIARTILNGLIGSLEEYTFLQLYQCIEYLFQLHASFDIASKHGIDVSTAIDIVADNDFRASEYDQLLAVIKNNTQESVIDKTVALINGYTEAQDKWSVCCKYIYMIRCTIAHLRYDQKDIEDIDWNQWIESILEVIVSMYITLDTRITQVCIDKNVWKQIEYSING